MMGRAIIHLRVADDGPPAVGLGRLRRSERMIAARCCRLAPAHGPALHVHRGSR